MRPVEHVLVAQSAVRRAEWVDCDAGMVDRIAELCRARNWVRTIEVSTAVTGEASLVFEVYGHDRWRVMRRIRWIDSILKRNGGGNLVSVDRLPPHDNRQASVDARQASRAAGVAARRAQHRGQGQVQSKGEQDE